MHNLEEADRHLFDTLQRIRRLAIARLSEARRKLHQRRRHGWDREEDGQLPEILLAEEFERLLGEAGCEAMEAETEEGTLMLDSRRHERRVHDKPVTEEWRLSGRYERKLMEFFKLLGGLG